MKGGWGGGFEAAGLFVIARRGKIEKERKELISTHTNHH